MIGMQALLLLIAALVLVTIVEYRILGASSCASRSRGCSQGNRSRQKRVVTNNDRMELIHPHPVVRSAFHPRLTADETCEKLQHPIQH